MPSVRRRLPTGLFDDTPPPDGITSSGGGLLPGPLGIGTDPASAGSDGRRDRLTATDPLDEVITRTFTLGADTYRLRQTVAVWSADYHEELVRPEEARQIIESVARQHVDDIELVSLLDTAVAQLSGLHQRGTFVLLRMRPRVSAGGSVAASQAYTPPARAQVAPGPPPPRPAEEPVVSAEVAAAQAATLTRAAETGVPFCEECARLAASRLVAAGA